MGKKRILSLFVLLCLAPLGLYFVVTMVNHLALPPRLRWQHTHPLLVHANRRSSICHLPDCPNYNSMAEWNEVDFYNAAEAEKA